MSTQKTRRKLLAMIATGGAVATGACVEFDREEPDPDPEDEGPEPADPDPEEDLVLDPDPEEDPEEDPDPDGDLEPDPEEDPEEDPTEEVVGENIREYGAEPNPADPSIEAAERNLDAIIEAANAAGSGGAIYVPEGTYYFGGTKLPPLEFGETEPPGISIYGAGPGISTLALSERNDVRSSANWTGFYYRDADHGEVEIANIKLEGNYENVPNLSAEGGGSRCLDLDGDGYFDLFNVHIRGWHMTGVRGRELLRTVDHCTFHDLAIARHNETVELDRSLSVSHCISARPEAGDTLTVTNTSFRDVSASAINLRHNDGELVVRNCRAEGTGANLMKMSAGARVELRNVYHKGNTESLEEKLHERPGGNNFWGRNFIQSLGERGEVPVNLDMEHVISRDTREYAFQSRGSSGDPATITWVGDMIMFLNANMVYNDEVIRARSGGSFSDIDIDRLSVHDSGGSVFDLEEADGTIDTLNVSGTNGVGNVDDVTIREVNNGTETVQPEYPSEDEVGIRLHEVAPDRYQ